jgi:hypothetical protein
VKPDATKVLETTLASLAAEVAPALPPGYGQSSVGVYSMLLMGVREEFDRAAARRAEENAALRDLFRDSLAGVRDAALRERLAAAAGSTEPSLRIPELEAANQELRALLIALHEHVETLEGDAARTLEESIWNELRAQTERRRLLLALF